MSDLSEIPQGPLSQVNELIAQRLRSAGLVEPAVREILANAPGPGFASRLAGLLTVKRDPSAQEVYNAFRHAVDDSDYPLGAWFQSLEAFYAWLGSRNRTAAFDDAVDYIGCCAAADNTGHPLPDLVRMMLEEYGFEGNGTQ